MAGFLPSLMAPGRIGGMEVRNRIVHAPMSLSLGAGDGTCGERFLAYYEARARGGAGLINIGTVSVGYPEGAVDAKQIAISGDGFIGSIAELARRVHAHGAKIMLQLNHNGPQAGLDRANGRPLAMPSIPVAGSGGLMDAYLPEELEELAALAAGRPAIADPGYEVLDEAGIARIVRMFADAAGRAKRAGVDAVEIHAGHGYLLQCFLSPTSNLRTDRYGGAIENRARFLLQVVEAVRTETGPDFPIVVKLDAVEFDRPHGITPADALWVARAVREAGADAITVTAYGDMSRALNHSGAHTPQDPKLLVPYAAAIRNGLDCPVITAGRIEPGEADDDIAAGRYDLVAMGRKLLADPDLPNRLSAGQPERIRPCIYCYACISQAYFRRPILCPINPEMGHEAEAPVPPSSAHMVVVGGGLTGLETARRLALAGSRVTLVEAGSALGGQLRVAAACDAAMARLLAWHCAEIERLKVEVRLNVLADDDLLRKFGAGAVVDARGGSRPALPAGAIDAADMAAVEARAATVAIVGTDAAGLALAAFHAATGARVHLVGTATKPGEGVALVRRWRMLETLRRADVAFHPGATRIVPHAGGVSFTDADGHPRDIPAGAVIVSNSGATPGFRTIAQAFADATTFVRQMAPRQPA